MWWQGLPVDIYMGRYQYDFVFYSEDGTAHPSSIAKADITNIHIDRRRAFAGMRPTFGVGRSALAAALFGGLVGACTMVATTRSEPSFENRWYFVLESRDGGIIELTYDLKRSFNGRMTRQGVATFLKDFRRNRGMYAV